jgi:hypothetical protein
MKEDKGNPLLNKQEYNLKKKNAVSLQLALSNPQERATLQLLCTAMCCCA